MGLFIFVLYLEGIIYLYQIIIIKEHFIFTYFYFLLSFLTSADVYVAINLYLANS